MYFSALASTLSVLEKTSSRLELTQILATLFEQLDPRESSIVSYLLLGNVNPIYVTTQFNFAEKSMLSVVSSCTTMTTEVIASEVKKIGDFGEVYAQALSHREDQKYCSIEMVYQRLVQFLQLSGTGSQKQKELFLIDLLQDLDAVSGKFVIRIILGKLRLGFSDMTLLDAFSWTFAKNKSWRKDLEEAYNVSADIGNLIYVLKTEGLEGVKKIAIIPGIPILPAAAERLSDAQAIVDKLGTCIAQPKLDGFRLQVHIDKTGDQPLIKFYSRNLQDMSFMFPDLYEAILDLEVKTLVAEGEAIAYDADTDAFLPFQETVKRKRKHEIQAVAQDFPLKLFFFDVLFCNGVSYLTKTHVERRVCLESLLNNEKIVKKATLQPIEERLIHTALDLENYFNENISQGLEGLVVKRPDALYQPGKRNFNWIKLKRQETGSLDDTIDCVILGYYAGRGKRASFGIGALLVGVYDKDQDAFVTVAKIGTGLSDDEWREQKRSCDAIRSVAQPHNIVCSKELYPDVWVNPEIVCMIRADEITNSPLHTAGKVNQSLGLALRFPRIMGYRPDKSATEATTVQELKRLFTIQFQRTKNITT